MVRTMVASSLSDQTSLLTHDRFQAASQPNSHNPNLSRLYKPSRSSTGPRLPLPPRKIQTSASILLLSGSPFPLRPENPNQRLSSPLNSINPATPQSDPRIIFSGSSSLRNPIQIHLFPSFSPSIPKTTTPLTGRCEIQITFTKFEGHHHYQCSIADHGGRFANRPVPRRQLPGVSLESERGARHCLLSLRDSTQSKDATWCHLHRPCLKNGLQSRLGWSLILPNLLVLSSLLTFVCFGQAEHYLLAFYLLYPCLCPVCVY